MWFIESGVWSTDTKKVVMIQNHVYFMDHFTLQSIVLAKLIAENISSFTRINQFINIIIIIIIRLIFSKQIN